MAVRSLYRELSDQTSLAPSPAINRLFGRLVTLASTPSDTSLIDDPAVAGLIPGIRRLAGEGETLLERYWSTRIVQSDDPRAELRSFPYYGNYHELTKFELTAIRDLTGRRPNRILFVGGGPLPLTSIMLAEQAGCEVDVMDIDPVAVGAADALLERLDPARQVTVIAADATTFPGYGAYDVVVMAALVGADASSKRQVAARIAHQLEGGAVLAARSATGNRRLLYPPVPASSLPGLTYLGEFEPPPGVINSLVLGRKDHATNGPTSPHDHLTTGASA